MDSTYATAVETQDFNESLRKEHSAVKQALMLHLQEMHTNTALLRSSEAMLESGVTHVNNWLQERGETHINAMLLAVEIMANVVLSVTDDDGFVELGRHNNDAFTLGTLTALSELAFKSVRAQLDKRREGIYQ